MRYRRLLNPTNTVAMALNIISLDKAMETRWLKEMNNLLWRDYGAMFTRHDTEIFIASCEAYWKPLSVTALFSKGLSDIDRYTLFLKLILELDGKSLVFNSHIKKLTNGTK